MGVAKKTRKFAKVSLSQRRPRTKNNVAKVKRLIGKNDDRRKENKEKVEELNKKKEASNTELIREVYVLQTLL